MGRRGQHEAWGALLPHFTEGKQARRPWESRQGRLAGSSAPGELMTHSLPLAIQQPLIPSLAQEVGWALVLAPSYRCAD